MAFRVLVGLPSFNGADTIGKVVSDIDSALRTLPFPVEAIHVNADSGSIDGTTAAFLAAETFYPKKAIDTGHWSGQGTNGRAALEMAVDTDADALLIVDTDLAAVDQTWVHALLGAVHDGRDFAYPLRPPTWNGGDLTYQLAYPLLAGASGVDLREPLCGDLALSRTAARNLIQAEWTADDLRFGFHVLVASTAVGSDHWTAARLEVRRRNPLRSFGPRPAGEFRMGDKFAETSASVRHHVRRLLNDPAPKAWTPSPAETPVDREFVVPDHDPDIARLAHTTAQQLRDDAHNYRLRCFPEPLRDHLIDFATGDDVERGIGWALWRECLFAWLTDDTRIPVDILETLFLNRAVGHHTEIAGRPDWYSTVLAQARDVFAHRNQLADGT
ncbi:glycosyltransferase [Nocardia cyriacigeorgica]|uniref:glycosyltransferase family 2 protein n=1 Tax=Nocardia cyriacigeorgica TaxID=135487 RepID=UPI00189621B9|nr:glycosyltransferase [Nocardia cyriacigeorgica]MBF6397891.1 glycosyltransferase [Nocardia cyriacigeorgica]MBF6402452.1 glycosyltransferase [Nocardia cyriacigeorgica]